jgi:putative chitinase
VILTMEKLAACTAARIDRAQMFLPHLIETMVMYEINTPARVAAFLAQVGHETGHLTWTSEIWGPTLDQARYERDPECDWPPVTKDSRNSKPYQLGNSEPGDGQRFKGRGLLQITGRANYASARDRMRKVFGMRVPDFVQEPKRLADAEWAALSAGDYWKSRSLNAVADAGDFVTLTRRINGGINGLQQRQALWTVSKQVLAEEIA